MASPETHRVHVDGGEHVIVDWRAPEADAPVAWFVHGFASHRRGDKAQYFGERFGALGWGYLAVDLRGHGESDGLLRDLTMTRALADVAAVAAWLPTQASPVLMIGSSMGAAVSAWHLLRTPLQVRGLAMIGPSLRFPAGFAARLAAEELEAWRRTGVHRERSEWLDVEIGYGIVEDAVRYDPERILREHRTPSLIFHGMRDEAVDWRRSLTFVEDSEAPDQQLVLIKDGDHRLTDHKAFLFETMLAWWNARR